MSLLQNGVGLRVHREISTCILLNPQANFLNERIVYSAVLMRQDAAAHRRMEGPFWLVLVQG